MDWKKLDTKKHILCLHLFKIKFRRSRLMTSETKKRSGMERRIQPGQPQLEAQGGSWMEALPPELVITKQRLYAGHLAESAFSWLTACHFFSFKDGWEFFRQL